MTGTEFQKAFGTELRQHDNRLLLAEEDVFYWLNLAQHALIREAFVAFEAETVVTPILRPLQRSTEIGVTATAPVSSGFTANLFPFPEDCQYVLSLQIYLIASTSTWRLCRIAQNDDVYRLLMDPFNRSTAKRPLASFGKELARVYTDNTFNVTNLLFDYIVTPDRITRDDGCVLPEFIHNDLVHKAVALYLANQPKAPAPPVSPSSNS